MTSLTITPSTTLLEIDGIEVVDRLRPTSASTVAALEFVIAEFGFTVPVLVRKIRSGFRLIDGAHRLEAMQKRGNTAIPAVVVTCTDEEARVLEGSQNLAGAAMSPLDEAIFVAAFSEAYQTLHPHTKRGVAGALAKNGLATDLKSFADVIGEKRSISSHQVRRIGAAGRSITRADADQLRTAARKVTLQDIQDLGKIAWPEERTFVIAAMIDGKKASAARSAWKAREAGVQPTIKDPVQEAFLALVAIWNRAPKAAKKRFCLEKAREILDIQNKGEALTAWDKAEQE